MRIWIAAFCAFFLVATAEIRPAAAAFSLFDIKNSLVQFALEQINVPGSLEIAVEDVQDVDDGATDLIGVSIADRQGVWLRIERISMNWAPQRLLRGELAITKLEASAVRVLRPPLPSPTADAPADTTDTGPVKITWPRAPLTVSVNGLRLNDVRISKGVIGDQTIAFDADGAFRDEGDTQSARLDVVRTDAVSGLIKLDYSRHFDTDRLDLTLIANEAPGGLVASLAGLPPGSKSQITLQGDGPILDWQAALQADIDNIGKANGTIVIPSIQPAEVRLNVAFDAQGELRRSASPLLDRSANLALDVLASEDGVITLRTLNLASPQITLAADGQFDANAGRVALNADARMSALGAPLVPGADVRNIRFVGKVSGLLDAIEAQGQVSVASLEADGVEAGGLSLRGQAKTDGGNVTFQVNGEVRRLLADRLDVTQNGPVQLNVAGNLRDQLLRLRTARLTSPLLSADVEGSANLARQTLDLRYSAAVPALAPVTAAFDADIAGAIEASGTASGPFAALSTKGSADFRGLRVDGQSTGDGRLAYDVTLGDAPAGTIVADADLGRYGPVNVDIAFATKGDVLTASRLQAVAFGSTVKSDGPVQVNLATQQANGRVTFAIPRLALLGPLAGTQLGGAAHGHAELATPNGRQSINVQANLRDFTTEGAAAKSADLTAAITDALGKAPGIAVEVQASDITAANARLSTATVTTSGTLAGLTLTASAEGQGPENAPISAQIAANANLVGTKQQITLNQLIARYGEEEVRLARPARVVMAGQNIEVSDLDLQVPAGYVRGSAKKAGNRLTADLEAALDDVTRIAKLANIPLSAGSIQAQIRLDSQKNASLRLTGSGLQSSELPRDTPPLALTLAADWDGRQVQAKAEAEGGFGDPLLAELRLPLVPNPASLFPKPEPSAPLAGSLRWAGQVEPLWAMVPAPDHYLKGQADIDLRVSGTLEEPLVSGKSELTNGRYENLMTGTILSDLTIQSEVQDGANFAVTLRAKDGGSAVIEGKVSLIGDEIQATITTNKATLVRRPDVEAQASLDLTASGSLLNPTIAGEVKVDRAEVRLVNAVPPSIATLGDVRIKGAPMPRPKPASDSQIDLDIHVSAPRNIFVRGRGLDSEWMMDLSISGTSSKPRVVGRIEKLRGQLVLVGRSFDLTVGEVVFSGAHPIAPDLNVRLLRQNDGIEGGIWVSGRPSDLKVNFVSTPPYPASEVMPRVLFGRSRQSLTPFEGLELASGIATLLDGSGGTIDRVRSAIGLDVLRIEDKGSGTAVTVGRNVNERVFVGASQPIDGSAPSATVEVDIGSGFAVESEVSQGGGTAVGVKWKYDF